MTTAIQFLERNFKPRLAYVHHEGVTPGVIFFPGYRSDMQGSKVLFLEELCRQQGRQFTRFDYTGHGLSEGIFEEGTLSSWFEDGLDIFDHITSGPQVIVGSSMGGWMLLKLLKARQSRIHGVIGLAVAPDFTYNLSFDMTKEQRQTMKDKGVCYVPSQYNGENPTPFTLKMYEDGLKNLVLHEPIEFEGPVVLIHGMKDIDISYTFSMETMKKITSPHVQAILIKEGDHRLSRPEDMQVLGQALETILKRS
jgi:pimeloyl-ACP methyl ester carboxylesterase